MTELQRFALGLEGVRYIRDRLADGKALGGMLLRTLQLDRGTTFTFLPPGVDERERLKFCQGGKLPQPARPVTRIRAPDGGTWHMTPKPNTRSKLADVIASFIDRDEHRACVFEDETASPDYPYLRTIATPIGTYKEDVYHFVVGPSPDLQLIERTIAHATSWLFICAMTVVPKDMLPLRPGMRQIEFNDLRRLAEGTEQIAVGAYDGEGYVLWSGSSKD